MDFSLTEEQTLLRDSVSRFVADHCSVEKRRQLIAAGKNHDPEIWRQFAELGWLSVPFPEALGGFGGSHADVMTVTQELGKGLAGEPFLSTVVTCGGALARAGSPAQQSDYLPDIIGGTSQWALAFAEADSGYNLASVSTQAVAEGDDYRLSGRKLAVVNGGSADYFLVSARSSGEPRGRAGVSLFIVSATAPGVSRESFTAVDGSLGAHLALDNVVVKSGALLGDYEQALPLLEATVDASIVALGGEAVGAMAALLDATVEYTRTREQFGQSISKFQALQHRMADMYLLLEETRSLLYNAAIQLEENSAESTEACAALKVKIAEAGRFISQQAVQLHGGIGMTDELSVGHYFKRLLLLAKLYGDEDYFLSRFIEARRVA